LSPFMQRCQCDSSEVLRLPRQNKMDTAEVLRLPHKTVYDTFLKHVAMSRNTKCHAKHAKLHWDLLPHHGKGKALQVPPCTDTATAYTEFSHCHHFTQPSPDNAICLKRGACYAKARWTQPKYCACHQKCYSSPENDAKVLRLLHKTTFDTS